MSTLSNTLSDVIESLNSLNPKAVLESLHLNRLCMEDDSDSDSFESVGSDLAAEDESAVVEDAAANSLDWIGDWECIGLLESEEEYLEKARACFDVVWTLYTSQDGWERCSAEDASALVEARNLPKIGKVFKLSGVIDIDPTSLFEEIYYNLSDSPQWNPTVLECKMIQAINECTDVFYSVAAEAAGGVVSARDLLNLRQWVVRDGVHIVTGVSCEHPDMPERKEYVRAENRPGAFIIEDVASDPEKARFVWILNTDLKGWIPKTLVDSALCSVMLDFFKHLKLRCEEIVNTSSRMSSTGIQEV